MIKFLSILYLLNYFFINSQKVDEPRNLDDLSDDILILHINDVHCGINDTIGYDGFVLYREEMKKKYKYIITIDVGDHVQGGTLGAVSDGEAIIKIMNEIGFDVAILGNHEFDYGVLQLTHLENDIKSSYTCANFCYKKNKTQIFQPYKIIEKNGIQIGFIGVLTPLTFSKTYLSQLKDRTGEHIYDFLTGNNTQELYDTIQKYINELRYEKKVDYVILLTHLGLKTELYTSDKLLSELEGVNAVLDGHTHKIYNITKPDKNGDKINIAQTGTKLESIGKLIIKSDGSISSEIIHEIPEPSDKTNAKTIFRGKKDRWVDINLNKFINDIWGEYSDELNEVFGHSNFDLIIRPIDDPDPHSVYCRKKECTLGNFVADAIKEIGKGEISIINGGGIRNNMESGDLTKGKLIDVLPWFNNVVMKQLTGKCILDVLEFGVSKWPEQSGGFPQVSGITFDINETINSSCLVDSNGMFINVTGERRVSNVKINGEDLVENKYYNVSLLEYMANGGDGYKMLTEFDIFSEALITDTDALCLYAEQIKEIPEIYKDLQGRINFINNTSKEESVPSSSSSSSPSSSSSSYSSNNVLIITLIFSIIAILILIWSIFYIRKGHACPKNSVKTFDINNDDSNSYIPVNI